MDYFGLAGWVLNLVTWMIPSPIEWIRERNKRKGRNLPITYKNDVFARDTIRYRFRNILHDLNDHYEDAFFKSLKNAGSKGLGTEKIARPFSYDTFTETSFKKPDKLMRMLDDASLLDAFYDVKYKDYLEKKNETFIKEAPFIDVEHHFYFYILDKYYSQDSDIQDEIASVIVKKPGDDKSYLSYREHYYSISDEKGISDGKFKDPYKKEKNSAIFKDLSLGKEDTNDFSRILDGLDKLVNYFHAGNNPERKYYLSEIIKLSLNSNSYDLSQLNGRVGHILNPAKCKVGDIDDFMKYIFGLDKSVRLNYLVDNSGVEFFSDLCLARILLNESVSQVVFHVNVLPIFVSDVISGDKEHLLNAVASYVETISDVEKQAKYKEGLALIEEMFAGPDPKARICPSFIWNMPTPYGKTGNSIFKEEDSLLVVKGDLNYRRLVEDKTWIYSKSLEKLTRYISCPALVIRCFKSDLVLDYKWKDYTRNMKEDPDWRGSGKYGVVRFLNGRSK